MLRFHVGRRARRIAACAALIPTVALIGASAGHAAPGALDPGFGSGGVFTSSALGTSAGDVALQADGKTVIALNAYEGGVYKVGVARHLTNGQLDPDYGTGGRTAIALAGSENRVATGVALDGQGRAVVVGWQNTLPRRQIFVARFTTSGALDPTFAPASGHPGYLFQTATGRDVTSTGVTVQSGGRIIVAGYSTDIPNPGVQGVLMGFTGAGVLDTTFAQFYAQPGVLTTSFANEVQYNAVSQVGDKLVAGGWSQSGLGDRQLLVSRFTLEGLNTILFGAGGHKEFRSTDGPQAQVADIGADASGRIIVAGQEGTLPSGSRLVTARLLPADGQLDATWNPTGPVPGINAVAVGDGDSAEATGMVVRPDGGVLVAGEAFDNGAAVFLAGRFGPTGAAVTGFGGPAFPGFALTPVGDGTVNVGGAVGAVDDSLIAAGRATIGLGPSYDAVALVKWTGEPVTMGLSADLAFGDVTVGSAGAAQKVTVTNAGQRTLSVSAFDVPADYLLVNPTACTTAALEPGASCTVDVAFRPTAAGDRSGRLTVVSNATGGRTSLALGGVGLPAPVVLKDVPIGATVIDAPSSPGDTALIQAKVTVPSGKRIVAYKWSTDGPDPKSITIDTGPVDKLLQRIGRKDATVWVWGVDEDGIISDTPARIDIEVPEDSCDAGTTVGDLRVGWLHIKSTACIKRRSGGADFVVPLQGGGASVNGLEVTCPSSGACGTLTIKRADQSAPLLAPGSAAGFTLTSTTPVKLRWPNGQKGTTDLGDQRLTYVSPAGSSTKASAATLPSARAARDLNLSARPAPQPPPIAVPRAEQPLGTFTVSGTTEIGTLQTDGKVSLSVFGPQKDGEPGMKLTANVKVPVPGSSTPAVAPLSQEADAEKGALTDGKSWEVDLGGVGFLPLLHFETLKLQYQSYVPAEDGFPARTGVFSFESVVAIDITGWTVAAEGVFSRTNGFERIAFGFHRNAGKGFTGLNLPTGRANSTGLATRAMPVQLDELQGLFQLKPYLSVGGKVRLLLLEKNTVGGSFNYTEAHGKEPWSFLAGVTFPLSGLTIEAELLVTGSPRPGVGLGGTVEFSVRDLIDISGKVYAYFGYDENRRIPVGEFGLAASITILSMELASAQGLINNDYLAGCGKIGALKAWGVYRLVSKTGDGGFGDCGEIAKYSLVPSLAGLARRTGRVASKELKVPAGVSWANLEVRAGGGLARVRIDGPGGFTYTTPEKTGVTGGASDRAVAMVDAPSHRTIIGIRQPKPGAYRVSTIAGAPAIAEARVAYSRPTSVKAKVGGTPSARTLAYEVDAPAGATVTFQERAGGATSIIGKATGARGTLPIKQSDLGPRARTIVARVRQDGLDLPPQVVARYTAKAIVPATPKRLALKLDRRRARATASWAKTPLADGYDVRITTSTGRRLQAFQRRTSLVIPSVYPGDRITVKVRGISRFKKAGPARTVTLRIAKAAR